MKVSDFNYELPKELIAQHPYDKRDEARLMVLDKENKKIENKIFRNVIDYLNPGDCLVINNTKVANAVSHPPNSPAIKLPTTPTNVKNPSFTFNSFFHNFY